MTTPPPVGQPACLSAVEAGEVLGLPPDVVRVLSDAGYLRPVSMRGGSPRYALGDLKAFMAHSAASTGEPVAEDPLESLESLDPDTLIAALDGRSAEMAERALDVLVSLFPQAAELDDAQRRRFLAQAHERFEAILAMCARGPSADEPVEAIMAAVGADAAHADVPLPVVLAVLRVSRDLVVQTAVEVAEERGRHWGLALAVVLTRVLPAIDRLTDAVALGYREVSVKPRT